jgi:hypothetical protein
MEVQEIEVIVDADGNVRVDVKGVKGKACTDITRALEAALGDDVQREFTWEANETPLHEGLGQYLEH